MNTTKKINVNFSSLVGLKAELLRKQTEVNEAKLRTEITNAIPKVKEKLKKPKKKIKINKSEQLTDVDDINAHKKSKLMLDAKTGLYDSLRKIKSSNHNFLVDFANKSDGSEDDLPKEEEEDDNTFVDTDEDGWVEYTDCFGRTRKCLQEDLPKMQQKDNLLKSQIMNKTDGEAHNPDGEETDLAMEKEPEIQIMRKKWEEQMQKLADKANIHYQDVLFDEARSHGVGYYAFSQDEEERIKQQENLAKLRKDTEQKQKEMQQLKESRTKMEENRLKAARIRRRIRAGLPPEPTEEELKQQVVSTNDMNLPNTTDEEHTKTISDSKENKSNDTDADGQTSEESRENEIKGLVELLGKQSHWHKMSQEEWVEKWRKARIHEFRPTYENFEKGGYLESDSVHHRSEDDEKPNESVSSQTRNIKLEDSTDSDIPPVVPAVNVQPMPSGNNSIKDLPPNVSDAWRQEETRATDPLLLDAASLEGNMNEENIMAGLKYLRKKFEQTHS